MTTRSNDPIFVAYRALKADNPNIVGADFTQNKGSEQLTLRSTTVYNGAILKKPGVLQNKVTKLKSGGYTTMNVSKNPGIQLEANTGRVVIDTSKIGSAGSPQSTSSGSKGILGNLGGALPLLILAGLALKH